MSDEIEQAFDLIDDAASHLANHNHVEMAWYLRGIIAGLNQEKADPPDEYKNEYMYGYRNAQSFLNQ